MDDHCRPDGRRSSTIVSDCFSLRMRSLRRCAYLLKRLTRYRVDIVPKQRDVRNFQHCTMEIPVICHGQRMEGKRLHAEFAVGKHPLHVAHCEIVDVVRWNPVTGIPPARYDLPKVVAIWNDDDGQPAIAKGRYGIGQQALGIENMLEHIVDDNGVGGARRFALEKVVDNIDAVLLTEFRQPVCGLIADIGVWIVFHDITELSASTSDLHDT